MKVLKFGGTSVANSESITHVVRIILKSLPESQVIVVSALGGITNILLEMAQKASKGNPDYKNHISTLEKRHLDPILHFISLNAQAEVITFLKSQLNELESLLESLFFFF